MLAIELWEEIARNLYSVKKDNLTVSHYFLTLNFHFVVELQAGFRIVTNCIFVYFPPRI